MLSRRISTELIPQRLAAVTIEKEFERLKDEYGEIDYMDEIESYISELYNDDCDKEKIARIGAIALRWLSDLYSDEFGKEGK